MTEMYFGSFLLALVILGWNIWITTDRDNWLPHPVLTFGLKIRRVTSIADLAADPYTKENMERTTRTLLFTTWGQLLLGIAICGLVYKFDFSKAMFLGGLCHCVAGLISALYVCAVRREIETMEPSV